MRRTRPLPGDYISRTQKIINPKQYRCPKCGGFMEYVDSREIPGKENEHKKYLLCRKDDIYCKTKKANSGNVYLESTPADKTTRKLRAEAHYYFNQIYEYNILPGKDSAYFWITHELGFVALGKSTYKHIGEMDELLCKRTIAICIDKLLENIHKLPNKKLEAYTRYGSYTMENSSIREKIGLEAKVS